MASRYLIGIDLGTTNSVVAYIDTQHGAAGGSPICVFPVPQLVAHGEVCTLPTLPSFLYFPTQDELSAGVVSATWNEDPPMVTGVHAREQGVFVPSRQVSSAKSWLAYQGVDRRARILPAQAEPPQPMISPVEASARYLMHLRDAWNGAMGKEPEARFEQQDIVLTVPASFYEDARELTVEAARTAGLENLTLLEEPLAAFYAWVAHQRTTPSGSSPAEAGVDDLKDGELILICDIGGGTTDFSLVRASRSHGQLEFERTAIGEHLLLGGDNLDSALAHHAEAKLGTIKLTLRQRYALRRACCTAKEQILGDARLERVPITILGGGQAVVGQSLTVDLTREEVVKILSDGFLPIIAPGDLPVRDRRSGLRELGLPYAGEPAITRHLAAFLTQAAAAISSSAAGQGMVQPDAVLFNGGFCAPAVTRERIIAAISAWFGGDRTGWRPRVLENNSVESAVARGAAYYGQVRRGTGLRIAAGSSRTFYIGLRSDDSLQGICILPAGVNEGTTLPLLAREFSVLANRSVSFTLFSSRTRHDAHGEVVALKEADIDHHPPLVTILRYGRRLRERRLNVRLRASFTEVGTLELWCESDDAQHRWRLQFELRSQAEQVQQPSPTISQSAPLRSSGDTASETTIESAVSLIRRAFNKPDDGVTPETLVGQLETTIGSNRDSWPLATVRRLADALIEVAAGRTQSPRHEMRWLNLAGFCLRPGLGAEGDAARINNLLTIVSHELAFKDELQCQVQLLVLLRRVAGGIPANAQLSLFRKHTSPSQKKRGRENRQVEHEKWRLFASLEHLLAATRAGLGERLLARIENEPDDAIGLWSLGRLGSRVPLYGPMHCVVPAETAGEWLKALLRLPIFNLATQSAVVLLARRIGDPSRDVGDPLREQAIAQLVRLGAAEDTVELLSRYVPPERADAVRSFGESLPPGLEIIGSSNCLLSLPALSSLDSFSLKST